MPGKQLLTVGQLRHYLPSATFLTDAFPSKKVLVHAVAGCTASDWSARLVTCMC